MSHPHRPDAAVRTDTAALATIRPANPEDAQAIADLVDRMWRVTYADLVDDDFWPTFPISRRIQEVHASLSAELTCSSLNTFKM